MSDVQFDDSFLKTQDDFTGMDFDSLEFGGIPSAGKHLVTIQTVSGYIKNFSNYSGPVAKLKMIIDQGPTSEDTGRFLWDDINLPHPSEKHGNKSRRALIASRLGLIPKGAAAVNIDWKALQGTQAVVTVIHKESNGKTYANVDFAGYENAATWGQHPEAASSQQTDWSDI